MSDYITLAVVQAPSFESFLVQAPAFCDLRRGDQVLLNGDDLYFTVVASMTCSKSSDEYQFCLDAFNASDNRLEKIRTKLVHHDFSYGNDDKSDE